MHKKSEEILKRCPEMREAVLAHEEELGDTKKLTDEILKRFPELRDNILFDQDEWDYLGGYSSMGELVDWVIEESKKGVTKQLINRIKDFTNWCDNQPRGASASDDILTIHQVAFFEDLCQDKNTHVLIRELADKDLFIAGKAYYIDRIGQDNYEQILETFESES